MTDETKKTLIQFDDTKEHNKQEYFNNNNNNDITLSSVEKLLPIFFSFFFKLISFCFTLSSFSHISQLIVSRVLTLMFPAGKLHTRIKRTFAVN